MPDLHNPQHGERQPAEHGSAVIIRPIRPEDEPAMARFHQTLSPVSVYTRYFNALKLSRRIAHERLCRICHPNPDEEAVLVAEFVTPDGGGYEIVGVGRLSKLAAAGSVEVALIVSDAYQGHGVGTRLLHELIKTARAWQMARVHAHVLADNLAMRHLCEASGMRLTGSPSDGEILAELDLRAHDSDSPAPRVP
jgi:acetyltransferase